MELRKIFSRLSKLEVKLLSLKFSFQREEIYDKIEHLKEDILSYTKLSQQELDSAIEYAKKEYEKLRKDVNKIAEVEIEEKEILQNID